MAVWFLDQKCPEATYKAYNAIRSFITFNGPSYTLMGPGYGLGDGDVWNEEECYWGDPYNIKQSKSFWIVKRLMMRRKHQKQKNTK